LLKHYKNKVNYRDEVLQSLYDRLLPKAIAFKVDAFYHAFPGNLTHDLSVDNAMLHSLSYINTCVI